MYRPKSLDFYGTRRNDSPLTIYTDSYSTTRYRGSPDIYHHSPRRQLSPSRSLEFYPKRRGLTRATSELYTLTKTPDHRRILSSYGGSRLSLPKSTDPLLSGGLELSASLNYLVPTSSDQSPPMKLTQIFASEQRLASNSPTPTPLYKFPFPSSNKTFWMRRMQAQEANNIGYTPPGKNVNSFLHSISLR